MYRDSQSKGVRWQASLTLAVVLQSVIAAGFWFAFKMHPWPAWLTGCSLVTFIYYGMDKWSAGRGWRRTPEFALWLLILMGGVLGGWLGQFLFRHKTRKASFWAVLILATALHGGLIWFFYLRQ